MLVNAAGPGSTGPARGRRRGPRERILRTTKGAHVLLPASPSARSTSPRTTGWSSIPWREFSLVGTTDTDYADSPDRVGDPADVQYLLEAARRLLTDPRITEANVAYTYAGVRPRPSTAPGRRLGRLRQHRVVAEGPEAALRSPAPS